MRVLGVDPGTIRTGVGVVDLAGDEAACVTSETLSAPSRASLPERLATMLDGLDGLIERFRPDVVALEQPFAGRNARTALAIGQAQGIAMAAAARRGIPVASYAPSAVKHAVADHGGASKDQVRDMVQVVLGLAEPPDSLDAADALAVALCHVNAARAERLVLTD